MPITLQARTSLSPVALASSISSIAFRRFRALVSLPLAPNRRHPTFLQHQQSRHLRHGLLLALQLLPLLRRSLRLEGFDLPLALGAELLELLLFGHRQHRLGVGI